jgi:hypothetical protein
MTVSPSEPPADAASLQFDKVEAVPGAETAPGPGSCAACNAALVHQYWASEDKTLCSSCAAEIRQRNAARPGFKGLLRAGLFGSAAAALGCGIYYLVSLTGWEFGLIAIVVGLLVGFAVRKGSGGHGGLAYQLLAVALTYCAITLTNLPYAVEGLLQAEHEEAQPAAGGAEREAGVPEETRTQPSTSQAHIGHYVVGFVLALALPFLSGTENIMGLVILAIGLWEAWKINRRVEMPLLGPYPIEAPASSS